MSKINELIKSLQKVKEVLEKAHKVVETHEKEISKITGTVKQKMELRSHPTHWSIAIHNEGEQYPQIKTGTEAYIRKQWKDLRKSDSIEKDELDEKIKAKLKAEMDKRNFGEADATRHVIDRDRGAKIPPPPPKPKQLMQTEQMVFKSNGQWSLEKDNSVKPFGQYTTSGSSMSQAHEAAQAKIQNAKTKASTRTLADMSDEEKAAIKAKYEKPLAKGADVVREALTTGQLPVMGDTASQPTNAQMFGHLVVSPEALKKTEERYQSGNKSVVEELSKPVDHLNKSGVEVNWSYGKSFNSLLKEKLSDKEIAERNACVSE